MKQTFDINNIQAIRDCNPCQSQYKKFITASTIEEKWQVVLQNTDWILQYFNLKLSELPTGLTVGGSLYLSGTGITELPTGLTVGGSLDLSGTGITELPKDLVVKERIIR